MADLRVDLIPRTMTGVGRTEPSQVAHGPSEVAEWTRPVRTAECRSKTGRPTSSLSPSEWLARTLPPETSTPDVPLRFWGWTAIVALG